MPAVEFDPDAGTYAVIHIVSILAPVWRILLLIAVGGVAVVVASKVTAPSPQDEKQIHVSDEFKTEARKTFDAIKRSDDYVTNAGIYYEPRLLEAQKALDSLRAHANGIAEGIILPSQSLPTSNPALAPSPRELPPSPQERLHFPVLLSSPLSLRSSTSFQTVLTHLCTETR